MHAFNDLFLPFERDLYHPYYAHVVLSVVFSIFRLNPVMLNYIDIRDSCGCSYTRLLSLTVSE